jgi:peptidoglycan DL-endopeptidase CwlO
VSLPGQHRRRPVRVVFLAVVALAAGVWAQPTAGAAPRPSLEQVRKQVDQLHDEAESATEKYNDTKDKIAGLQLQVTASRTKIEAQQQAVQKARFDLGRIAVDSYKAGDLATLSLFLGDDPDDYLAANGLYVSLGDQKAQAVEALQRQQQLLVGGITDVQEQQQRLQQAVKDLETTRTAVLAKLEQATSLLGRLTDAERGQLGRLRSGGERKSLSDLGITVPASGKLTCADVPVAIPPGRAGKVVSYACAQIGDPYLWGADGPRNFDCSGLTLMAWRQASVSLPHNAAAQAEAGTPVSRNELQAGDLVFYHRPISHVGIYIGHGLMLHAPRTGDVVKIVPLRPDMVAAVRL